MSLASLVEEARELMRGGVYDPSLLFELLYRKHVVHYTVVREAVHKAKEKGA